MEYKVRKLSINDIKNLNSIYLYLENHPKCLKSLFENTRGQCNHHATKIGALDQREARGSTAGTVIWRGQQKLSKLSIEHPNIDVLLHSFMTEHNPEFNYKSVYITKNCKSKPHKDSGNSTSSIIVSMGDHEGGALCIDEGDGRNQVFTIRKYSLEFDGRKYLHWTQDFVGTRYSLIYFN